MKRMLVAMVLFCVLLLVPSSVLRADAFKFLNAQLVTAKALISQKKYDEAVKALRAAMFSSDWMK